jgi:hypothetical protein
MPDAPLFSDATILDFGEDPGKEALLRTILVWLSDRGHIPRDRIRAYRDTAMQREALGSTGFGRGLAAPFFRLTPAAREVPDREPHIPGPGPPRGLVRFD